MIERKINSLSNSTSGVTITRKYGNFKQVRIVLEYQNKNSESKFSFQFLSYSLNISELTWEICSIKIFQEMPKTLFNQKKKSVKLVT